LKDSSKKTSEKETNEIETEKDAMELKIPKENVEEITTTTNE